jgi:hypothetical protein
MPLLESRVSAVLPVCRASAEFSKPTALDAVLVCVDDVLDVVELADELVVLPEPDVLVEDEPDAVLEELPEVEAGAVGWKKLLPAPKPTLAA